MGWAGLGVADIFAQLEPINHLIEPLDLCPGAPALVAGYGYSGKTVAIQSAAVSIAAGFPVWGMFPARRGRVLHVDYEQGPRLTRERYQRLAAGMRLSPDDLAGNLELVSMPSVYLDAHQAEDFFTERCEGVDLVIVDSLRVAAPSLDENDSDIRSVFDRLNRVSHRTGCCSIIIHHARKPSMTAAGGAKATIRGSGAIFDASGSVLIFDAVKGKPIRVSHEKARSSGITVPDFSLTIADVVTEHGPKGGLAVTAQALGAAPSSAPDGLRDRIRQYLLEHGDERPSKTALCKILAVKRDPFFAAMAEMEATGEVINAGTKQKPVLKLARL